MLPIHWGRSFDALEPHTLDHAEAFLKESDREINLQVLKVVG